MWICLICNLKYDEIVGMPEEGIPPGTKFEDIPDDWCCPLCGIDKSFFEKM